MFVTADKWILCDGPCVLQGHSAGIFGKTKMGATIVDALDTLMIMGLTEVHMSCIFTHAGSHKATHALCSM